MEKKKIILYLTDITHHVKDLRPAKTFEKSIKGTLPEGSLYGRLSGNMNKDGVLEVKIPDDMQAAIDRGEIEVMLAIPKNGLVTYAGKDVPVKIAQMEKKKRNQIIHSGRVWRKEGI